MTSFRYKALAHDGSIVQGNTVASSKDDVCQWLERKNLEPIWIQRASVLVGSLYRLGQKKIDWEPFFRYIACLTKGGITLIEALNSYQNLQKKGAIQQKVSQLLGQLKEGKNFPQAFSGLLPQQADYLVGMMEVCVHTGELSECFLKIADYFREKKDFDRKMRSVLRYPLFLCGIIFPILWFLCAFLLPQVQDFFVRFDRPLPYGTYVFLRVASFLSQQGVWLLISCGGGIIMCVLLAQKDRYRIFFENLLFRVPFYGEIRFLSEIYIQISLLASLMSARVDLLRSVQIVLQQTKFRVFQKNLGQVRQSLMGGRTLAQSFQTRKIYPTVLVEFIQIGEKTDTLSAHLIDLKRYFEQQLEEKRRFFLEVVQPLILIFLGLLMIGFVLILFYPFYAGLSDVLA